MKHHSRRLGAALALGVSAVSLGALAPATAAPSPVTFSPVTAAAVVDNGGTLAVHYDVTAAVAEGAHVRLRLLPLVTGDRAREVVWTGTCTSDVIPGGSTVDVSCDGTAPKPTVGGEYQITSSLQAFDAATGRYVGGAVTLASAYNVPLDGALVTIADPPPASSIDGALLTGDDPASAPSPATGDTSPVANVGALGKSATTAGDTASTDAVTEPPVAPAADSTLGLARRGAAGPVGLVVTPGVDAGGAFPVRAAVAGDQDIPETLAASPPPIFVTVLSLVVVAAVLAWIVRRTS